MCQPTDCRDLSAGLSPQEIKTKIEDLLYFTYKVEIFNIMIDLKPNLEVQKSFTAEIPYLQVYNEMKLDDSRNLNPLNAFLLNSDYIWILSPDLVIKGIDRDINFAIVKDLKVGFTRLLLENYYEKLFGSSVYLSEIYYGQKISIEAKRILANMRRDEFVFLMSFIYNNIIYNDGRDPDFFSSYVAGQPGKPRKIDVDIERLMVYFVDSACQKKVNFIMNKFVVMMDQQLSGQKEIRISGKRLDGNRYLVYQREGHAVQQKLGFIKEFSKLAEFKLEKIPLQTVFPDIKHKDLYKKMQKDYISRKKLQGESNYWSENSWKGFEHSSPAHSSGGRANVRFKKAPYVKKFSMHSPRNQGFLEDLS